MTMAMTQPPMSGLSGLMDFTDNLQEADTGIERMEAFRQLQTPGLQAMEELRNIGLASMMMDDEPTEEDFIQYSASGGLVGLPVIQAGFGGFIGKILKAPAKLIKSVGKGISKVAKSPLGKMAMMAIPTFFGMPPVFSNTMLNSAFYSTAGSLLTGAKPKDALMQGGLSALGTYGMGKMGIGTGADYLSKGSKLVDAPGSLGMRHVSQGVPKTGQFGFGAGGAGATPRLPGIFRPTTVPVNTEKTSLLGSVMDVGKNVLSTITDKVTPDLSTPEGKAKAAGMALGGLQLLGAAQQPEQVQTGLATTARPPVETDFDKKQMVYMDPITQEELTNEEAIRRQRAGERVTMKDRMAATGGLIGMAYGGSMPEFAGQVPGQGHGMEDNVYMPIKERQAGQQVGTLAVSPDEYVVDSYTMSLLGNGSPDAGAQVMDRAVKDVRMAATGNPRQQQEIDGLETLNRMRGV